MGCVEGLIYFSWLGWRDSLLSLKLQKCRGAKTFAPVADFVLLRCAVLETRFCTRACYAESHSTKNNENSSRSFGPRTIFMAGVEGFEPPNARTKTWCLTTWPHPIGTLASIAKDACLGKLGNKIRPEG